MLHWARTPKVGSHRAADYLATLANSKFTTLIFATQIVAVFLKYSRSCGKLLAVFAKCTSSARHCSPQVPPPPKKKNENGEQFRGKTVERLVTVWRRLGEDLVNVWQNVCQIFT